MGFFGRLFGSEKEELSVFSIGTIPSLVQPKIDERMNRFKPHAESFLYELKSNYEKLDSSLKQLGQAQIAEQVDPQLLEVSLTSRQMFISKMRRIENKIRENPEMDLTSLTDYFNSIASTVDDIDDNTVKEYQTISIVFKREVRQVLKEFKNFRESLKRFNSRIKKENDHMRSNLEIIQLTKEVERIKEKIEQVKKEEQTLNNTLIDEQKNKDDLEKSLHDFLEGEEWNQFLELRKSSNKNEIQTKELISEVVQLFGSIERLLKKYKKHVKEENEAELIEQFINSPYDAFVSDKERKIVKILENVASSFDSIPELKGEEKSLDKLRSFLSSNLLEDFWKKNGWLMQENKRIKDEIENSETLKRHNQLERDSYNKLQAIRSLEKNMSDNKILLEKLQNEFNEKKMKLESKLKDFFGNEIKLEEN